MPVCNNLTDYPYDVTGFRPYRWLPFTAYDAWIEKWNDCKAELEWVKSDILANYDRYVNELAAGFEAVAHASWKSIIAQGYDWAIIDGKPLQEDEFVEYVVANALAKMPSKAKIETELAAKKNFLSEVDIKGLSQNNPQYTFSRRD